jgi:hypothetical protein
MEQGKELYFAAGCVGCGGLLPVTRTEKYWVRSHKPYTHYEVLCPRCGTGFIVTDSELVPLVRVSTLEISAPVRRLPT